MDLEGNPASVLVHLVKRDQAATNMLDTSTDAQEAMNRYIIIVNHYSVSFKWYIHCSVKERLHDLMRSPDNFTEKSYEEVIFCVSNLGIMLSVISLITKCESKCSA